MPKPDITTFITNFKRGHNEENLIEVFTEGNCFHFALLLSNIEPDGAIVYDPIQGHFMYKVEDKFYDITGEKVKPNNFWVLD
jgi:hypothetical protein